MHSYILAFQLDLQLVVRDVSIPHYISYDYFAFELGNIPHNKSEIWILDCRLGTQKLSDSLVRSLHSFVRTRTSPDRQLYKHAFRFVCFVALVNHIYH